MKSLSCVWLFATLAYQAPPWDFPGKSTGVGCHFLLQEIFPTQVSSIIGSCFTVWATREVFFRVPASVSQVWEQKDKQSLYYWNFEMVIIMKWLWMYPMLMALSPSHETPSIPLPLSLSLCLQIKYNEHFLPLSKNFLVSMLKSLYLKKLLP